MRKGYEYCPEQIKYYNREIAWLPFLKVIHNSKHKWNIVQQSTYLIRTGKALNTEHWERKGGGGQMWKICKIIRIFAKRFKHFYSEHNYISCAANLSLGTVIKSVKMWTFRYCASTILYFLYWGGGKFYKLYVLHLVSINSFKQLKIAKEKTCGKRGAHCEDFINKGTQRWKLQENQMYVCMLSMHSRTAGRMRNKSGMGPSFVHQMAYWSQ